MPSRSPRPRKRPCNGPCIVGHARVGWHVSLLKIGRPIMSKPQAHPPQTTGDSGACQPKSPPVSGLSNAVYVAVGILRQADGRVLLGSRPIDKPWAHWWELPGGKIEPHETARQALARELDEELGIQIELSHAQHWNRLRHRYPSGWVVLDFFLITKWQGTPKALEGQNLAWVQPHQLGDVGPVLPATLDRKSTRLNSSHVSISYGVVCLTKKM